MKEEILNVTPVISRARKTPHVESSAEEITAIGAAKKYSGKTPDSIVVGDVDYSEYLESYRTEEPPVYRYIVQRLSYEYRFVYDHAGQKIYARR